MYAPTIIAMTFACSPTRDSSCPDGSTAVAEPSEGWRCENTDGQPVGPHIRDRADGTPWERGTWSLTGQRTGTWTRFHPSGARAREEQWVSGVMDGHWAEWDEQGVKRLSGAFSAGSKHGKWWDWSPEGHPTELTNWLKGKRQGPAVSWYDDGTLKSVGHFEEGEPAGLWIQLHENGVPASLTPWLDGSKHGEERVLSPTGSPLRQTLWQHGRSIEVREWHLSGAVARTRSPSGAEEMYSASGERLKSCVPQDATLVCVEWFEDAGKRFQYQLIDSRKEGPYRAWHQSGQLAAEGQYQRGRRDGVWRFLKEDGSVDAERSGTYKNGALEDGVHP